MTSTDGQTVEQFRTQRGARLLAYLACRPHCDHPREVLGELLWPDAPSDTQRSRLRYELSKLRTLLGDTALETKGNHSVRLAGDCTSDIAEFDALVRTAARSSSAEERVGHLRVAAGILTKGQPLCGFYDSWSVAEQERLMQAFFDCLLYLVRDLRLQGQRDEAELWFRTLVERFPNRADDILTTLKESVTPQSPRVASLPVAAFRVPTPSDGFFGRVAEQTMVQEWVNVRSPFRDTERLLTVTGLGGMGKTRLALEVAASFGEQEPLWFVRLEMLRDPERFWEVLQRALPFPESSVGGSAQEQVINWLRSHDRFLLLLDNFEQIADGGAERLAELLATVPGLRCLVTSRRKLAIAGERELPLQGLPVSDAVQLFTARARAVRGTWQATQRIEAEVEKVCHFLEGIPLAVELAAARSLVLDPAQISAQLKDRFSFLVDRRRDRMPRLHSLRNCMEWSTDLLPPELHRFLARLSVFRGGFTLATAGGVCTDDADTPSLNPLEALEQLRSDSLLTVRFEDEGGVRYFLLETVREYADLLLADTDRFSLEIRHRDYFLSLLVEANRDSSTTWSYWSTLDEEYENFRVALATCDRSASDPPSFLLRFILEIRWLWERRSNRKELLFWLDRAVARFEDALLPDRAVDPVLTLAHQELYLYAEGLRRLASALIGSMLPQQSRARALFHRSAALYRGMGDTTREVQALNSLGAMEIKNSSFRAAHACLMESVRVSPALGQSKIVAESHHYLGVVYAEWGEFAEATRLFQEAERFYAGRNLTDLTVDRAVATWYQGSVSESESLFQVGLAARRRQGYTAGEAYCLTMLGRIKTVKCDYREALELHQSALALLNEQEKPGHVAAVRMNRGITLALAGNHVGAEEDFRHSLELCRAIGDRLGEAFSLEYQADLCCRTHGDYAGAVVLWATAACIRADLGAPVPPIDLPGRETLQAEAIARIGIELFDTLWFSTLFPIIALCP